MADIYGRTQYDPYGMNEPRFFQNFREGGEEPTAAPARAPARDAAPSGGGGDLNSLIKQLMQQQSGQFQDVGPVTYGRSRVSGGMMPVQVRGGFAPGTAGYQFEQMLPQILASLFGGGAAGGPKREDLLNPRLADITERFGSERKNLLNRFAGAGRDVTGSVPTEALSRAGLQETTERQRATGDVDEMLARLGIQQQGAASQRLQSIIAIMQALGMGGGR